MVLRPNIKKLSYLVGVNSSPGFLVQMKSLEFAFEINWPLKFMHIFWEATKICEISILLLSYVVPIKSKVEILQNFVAFSKYMNFIALSKGQLISECTFAVFKFPKTQRKIWWISALKSKKWPNQ